MSFPLLYDVAQECGANGEQLQLIKTLSANNPIVQDAPWEEATGPTSHEFTVDSNLPAGTWRGINQGVPVEKGGKEKVTEGMGQLATYSQVDRTLVDLHRNKGKYLDQQVDQFVRGLGKTIAKCLFYGNPNASFTMEGAAVLPNSKKFYGLAPRYNAVTATNANVVLAEANTDNDNTSVYVVQWGLGRVTMFYPSGRMPGLKREDIGLCDLRDANSNEFRGYKNYFEWMGGLAVYNTRCVKRLANIDADWTQGTWTTAGTGGADKLLGLLNDLPDNGEGAVIYCNAFVKTLIDCAAVSQGKGYMFGEPNKAWGTGPVTYFHGFPVRKCDAILSSVSAGTTGEHIVA